MERRIEIEELLHHADWLRRLATSLVRDPSGADDLVQDTWIAALRRPPAAEPRAWLARVARNLAGNARRERERRAAREELAHEERPSPAPEDVLQEAEAQRLLAEAVTQLAEEWRAVVVLRYFRGLDSAAIARELGLSPSAVRTRLQRALEALRAELDRRHGGERRAWGLVLAPYATAPAGVVLATGGAALAWSVATWTACAGGVLLVAVLGVKRWALSDMNVEPALTSAEVERALVPVEPVGEPAAELRQSERTAAAPEGALAPAASAAGASDPIELAGRIFVEGKPAEFPMELWIQRPDRMSKDEWNALVGNRQQHIVTTVEQPDRFTFGALPAGWSGRLRVEHGFFASGDDTLELAAPARDLVLALHAAPMIVGRLLDAQGEPVGAVRLTYEVRKYDAIGQGNSKGGVLDSNDAGRFQIPLDPWADSASATILVEADERGYLRHEIPVVPLSGFDAGDLVLEPVRSVALRVLDSEHRPIADAFARIEGPSWSRRSEPTDEEGQTILRFAPERPTQLRVRAFRYADHVVQVEPGASCEIELERLTTLDVQLVVPNETIEPRGDLAVRAQQSLFLWDSMHGDLEPVIQSDLGGAYPHDGRWSSDERAPEDGFELLYRPAADDHYVLVGLRPGVPFTVEARAKDGHALAARTLTLVAGEWAELELPLAP